MAQQGGYEGTTNHHSQPAAQCG
ncbi:hypothetical protein VTH82DRAFT_7775 [Thermothelomyces myriococcoides]